MDESQLAERVTDIGRRLVRTQIALCLALGFVLMQGAWTWSDVWELKSLCSSRRVGPSGESSVFHFEGIRGLVLGSDPHTGVRALVTDAGATSFVLKNGRTQVTIDVPNDLEGPSVVLQGAGGKVEMCVDEEDGPTMVAIGRDGKEVWRVARDR